MRTVTEHVNMKLGDVTLWKTNTGTEYLQYSERDDQRRPLHKHGMNLKMTDVDHFKNLG